MSEWPQAPSPIPSRIIANRYRLKYSLGAGALGEVFQAEDTRFNPPRTVAIKVVHPENLLDPQQVAQIKHEAGVMAQFNHPNILRIIDFEITPAEAYLVTDLAEGGTLKQKLHPDSASPPRPMSFSEIDNFLEQICAALDEAHRNGLVHRDIKPQNVLIDRNGRPLLADFGLALRTNQRTFLTQAESWGTAEYAAPEVWQGQVGKASDIYALGALTYEMLTGYPPFQGEVRQLEEQHLHTPVPPLAKYAPHWNYPREFDAVLSQAMHKNAAVRFPTAGDFYRSFKRAIGGTAFPQPQVFTTVVNMQSTNFQGATAGSIQQMFTQGQQLLNVAGFATNVTRKIVHEPLPYWNNLKLLYFLPTLVIGITGLSLGLPDVFSSSSSTDVIGLIGLILLGVAALCLIFGLVPIINGIRYSGVKNQLKAGGKLLNAQIVKLDPTNVSVNGRPLFKVIAGWIDAETNFAHYFSGGTVTGYRYDLIAQPIRVWVNPQDFSLYYVDKVV
jgi:serine/threonine-protein kinase